MILTLLAVSLNERPLSQPITARFDGSGGTIGRADHNTMALPDPERHISRLQAEIVPRGDGFLIRNVGSANPIIIAGRPLAQGESTALAHADTVRIGGYLLQVDCHPQSDPQAEIPRSPPLRAVAAAPVAWPTPAPATPPRTAAPAPGVNPFADLLGGAGTSPGPSPSAGPSTGLSAGNPFADLLQPSPPPSAPAARPAADDPFGNLMPPPSGIGPRSSALASAPPPTPRLPDDFDPFAPPPAPAALPAAAVDPFADLGSGAAAASIDQLYNLGPGAAQDPLAGFMASTTSPPPARPGGAGLPTDPLLLFGSPGAASAPPVPQPPQPDQLPAVNAAYQPPRPQPPAPAGWVPPTPPPPSPRPSPPPLTPAPPPAATAAAAVPAALAASADANALWAAFCQGAGVALPLPADGGPATMHAVGRILHSAVAGTLQLMAVRASTRHELRAAVTIIQPRNNNPLKFSPDARAGIEQLVQPAARGFLDGPAAMEDAMHDLVGHSIGTVAGMRAAIEGMLDRFDPAALESKLTSHSMFDSLLPGSRRARLWELYLEHHRAIREEAQEDFHTLFGKAFVAAYEQQIDRLRQQAAAAAAAR